MPRREDIDRFTQVLNSLGNEPAIRAARSEAVGEVPAPGEEPQAGVALAEKGTPSAEGAGPGTGEQENLQDLFASLSALPEEETAAAEAQALAEPGVADAGPGEELNFASLFGEEAEPQGIEELEKPGQGEPAGREQEAEPGAPVSEDTFSLPEGGLESLSSDLTQMEALPEDLGQPEAGPGEEAVPAAQPGGESFEDLGSFSLDEAEAPAAMPTTEETIAPEAPALAEPGQPAEAEGFELPSLDDLSFSEPLEAAPAPQEPPPGEPSGGPSFEAPQEPAFEALPPEIEPQEGPPEEPGAEQPAAAPAIEEESLGEESLGDLNLDEFSLPESAEQFGMPEAQPAAPKKRAPAPPPRAPARAPRPQPERPAPEEGAAAPEEIQLTPEQFAQVKRTLEALPRNLKIVVQDLIGEGMVSGADLAALVGLLLQGAAAQEIATLASRISGKRIRIPAGYEKKTGVAFEAEQRTFAYAFRENILPLLRIVVITVVAGGLFGFLGYRYIYQPLFAFTNYRAGYAQIRNDRFAIANERFDRASKAWPIRGWYYRYADAFADKRQFILAEQKYDALLSQFPGDKKGILDYARMESERLNAFEKADGLLKRILDKRMFDYDALLAAGDNDMRWAEVVPDKIKAARLAYATLIDKYGAQDTLLFRMLRYFIRSNNGEEVERLRAFYASRPDVKIDAAAFAELGGYLIDHRRLDYAQDVLFRADKNQPGLYEVHYNLARYYRLVQSDADEKKALDATVKMMKSTDVLTPERLRIEIDTHTRLGEYNYRNKEYITAENELQDAIALVGQNQKMKTIIDKNRIYGRPYADLGDLYYYIQGDLQAATLQYQAAIANLYTAPELSYKIGYIQYMQKDYKAALVSFTSTEDASAYPSGNEALAPAEGSAQSTQMPGQTPQNLLYALATTFFQRKDFFAAQGYYLRLLDRLETRRAALGTLHPEDSPDDRALLQTLVKVNNNLGVTMINLAARTGDRKKRSEALVYLSAAAEIAGLLARNPDTVQRSEIRSLPSFNMHWILYPVPGYELLIYSALPKDFEITDW
ncbi:MAG: hypothetical protein ABSF77_01865 [Spirochaetia bacterium]|jgi:tetratricopeptide (TPR) repeat protein